MGNSSSKSKRLSDRRKRHFAGLSLGSGGGKAANLVTAAACCELAAKGGGAANGGYSYPFQQSTYNYPHNHHHRRRRHEHDALDNLGVSPQMQLHPQLQPQGHPRAPPSSSSSSSAIRQNELSFVNHPIYLPPPTSSGGGGEYQIPQQVVASASPWDRYNISLGNGYGGGGGSDNHLLAPFPEEGGGGGGSSSSQVSERGANVTSSRSSSASIVSNNSTLAASALEALLSGGGDARLQLQRRNHRQPRRQQQQQPLRRRQVRGGNHLLVAEAPRSAVAPKEQAAGPAAAAAASGDEGFGPKGKRAAQPPLAVAHAAAAATANGAASGSRLGFAAGAFVEPEEWSRENYSRLLRSSENISSPNLNLVATNSTNSNHRPRRRKLVVATTAQGNYYNKTTSQQQATQAQEYIIYDHNHTTKSSHKFNKYNKVATTTSKRNMTATNLMAAAASCQQQKGGPNETSRNQQNNNHHQHQQHAHSQDERGLALSEEERSRMGLLGLLPAKIQDQELQMKSVINFIDNCKDELAKYVYLRNLKDFNEKLFYFSLMTNVEKLMPIVYTPTVGLACQKFSEIYMRPRGLFVTARDAGRVRQVVGNWHEKDVRVVVMTDGERILGLGDLGANGMGIPIGKLSLYTSLAGIPPQNVLPVTIDVGTNNKKLLEDPFYIGLRQERVRGEHYESLIKEFMEAVVERWGRSCLIQFEDFANGQAFDLLRKYRNNYCTFNDDIQGTASVCLSGLISAAKLIGKRVQDCTYLFYGAGEANLGAAQLLIMAMCENGATRAEAEKRIYLVDSRGLVVKSRTDLNEHKQHFARDAPQLKGLEEILDLVKPTAIIGASAQAGAFNETICRKMAQLNERCIIFALSNPTSKAECTAAQAYEWTQGKCVFASGSPFDPVEYGGKTFITGQGNNAYIFPAVGLATIAAHTHTIPEEVFLVAARALSDQLTESDTSVGLVYPRLSKIREVTLRVATRVLEFYYAERLATYRPEPSDKYEFLKSIQYDPRY